ncbi:MAG TPA: TlyA family RNA methyltransferase [Thermoanaerobaculia bacterium]|jgi:23S rRNA (cytidine1920-2'-O)/16S rRNA (cytidine1409-2'-O)-methyltransferase|nr:TlyA family RNA methyltransferase [Thermoanaerobaculia bacterium]
MRLDQLLAARRLFASREQARRAVMAGEVRVAGQVVDKPGASVADDAPLEVAAHPPFVSRGGLKLAAALDHFHVDVTGRVCLDVGASTGGFTDCLLQRGAARVYALDVGRGQLDWRLRQDPRVITIEGVNARHLAADALPERCDLATVDVSFISLLKVVPPLLPHLRPGALLVTLVKPQFEAGRAAIGKGGIVRDEAVRRQVIDERVAQLAALGLERRGLIDSPVAGAEGNVEALAAFATPAQP